MDLIHACRLFDIKLLEFEGLWTKKNRHFAGSFYFREYLSRGALKIEDKCQIVSAQEIMDQKLSCLRPEFGESMMKKAIWANEVVHLREAFYQRIAEPQ
jgi:hypothetical protein